MPFTISPNLGPLTTYWTPPSTCLSTITFCSDPNGQLWLGQTGNLVDPRCYPTNFATDDVYSPGVCPSGEMFPLPIRSDLMEVGWTSACTPAAGISSPIFPTTVSAIQCCPSYVIAFSCGLSNCTHLDHSPATVESAFHSMRSARPYLLQALLASLRFPLPP
jgi:hypothetical protein